MNYTILAVTALVMAIVAVAVVLRELWKSKALGNDIYLKSRTENIGEEAWRLLVKQTHGKSHTSKLAKGGD